MTYLFVKWLHILSATVLFGTGLGTAFQMWMSHRHGDFRAIAVTARNVVKADWWFTATSGVLQPVTGGLMIWMTGYDPLAWWLVWSYGLYAVALGCWLPVVGLQIRVRNLAEAAVRDQRPLPDAYFRCMRWWFALGWPAFISLLAIFWLMVTRPV